MKPSIDSAAPGSAAYKRRRRGAGPAVRERLRDGSGRVRFGRVSLAKGSFWSRSLKSPFEVQSLISEHGGAFSLQSEALFYGPYPQL